MFASGKRWRTKCLLRKVLLDRNRRCLTVLKDPVTPGIWLTSGCLDAETLRVPERLLLLNVKLDQSVGEEELRKGKHPQNGFIRSFSMLIFRVAVGFFLFVLWMKVPTPLAPHPVDNVDSADGADSGRVVDEADVSLCGGVKLSDLDVPEAVEEVRPNVCPDAVADGDPHSVVLLVVPLQSDIPTRVRAGGGGRHLG